MSFYETLGERIVDRLQAAARVANGYDFRQVDFQAAREIAHEEARKLPTRWDRDEAAAAVLDAMAARGLYREARIVRAGGAS